MDRSDGWVLDGSYQGRLGDQLLNGNRQTWRFAFLRLRSPRQVECWLRSQGSAGERACLTSDACRTKSSAAATLNRWM
jgi:hypothetical protein